MSMTANDHTGKLRRSINYRCARCEAPNHANVVWKDLESPVIIRCAGCGHRYRLDPTRPRQRSDQAYYMMVKQYAEKWGLDMATACSVIEGIMPIERALDLRGRPARARPKRRGRWTLLPLGLALVFFFGAGMAAQIWTNWSHTDAVRSAASPATGTVATMPPASDATGLLRLAETEVDAAGRLLRVSAPDPAAVLLAFCEFGWHASYRQPLGLAEANPPTPDMKLGIYRDHGDLSRRFAIRIFRDPRAGRWAAGLGREPLHGAPNDLPLELVRPVPVRVARGSIPGSARELR